MTLLHDSFCIDPRVIVPLTGVGARVLLPAATPGAAAGTRFAFELSSVEAGQSLIYTEKSKDSKLRQGKEQKLLFAAASAKERDIWLSDICSNQVSTPTKVPFSALLESSSDDEEADRSPSKPEKESKKNGASSKPSTPASKPSSTAAKAPTPLGKSSKGKGSGNSSSKELKKDSSSSSSKSNKKSPKKDDDTPSSSGKSKSASSKATKEAKTNTDDAEQTKESKKSKKK